MKHIIITSTRQCNVSKFDYSIKLFFYTNTMAGH